jgi:hypothetical protein
MQEGHCRAVAADGGVSRQETEIWASFRCSLSLAGKLDSVSSQPVAFATAAGVVRLDACVETLAVRVQAAAAAVGTRVSTS